MTDNFYKYISHHNNGFQIVKDNEHYGWFDDVRDALYERDRLISVNWDLELWVDIEETPNSYSNIVLPPFDSKIKHLQQYVYFVKTQNSWRVQKKVNGKLETFGYYSKLEDALKRRNELIECDWEC